MSGSGFNNLGIGSAVLAAVLFGISTPFAKLLVGQIPPVALAGMLYLGAGIGLLGWLALHQPISKEAALNRQDLPWLAGAIVSGGIAGPVLLMVGLTLTPATNASLLLNLEVVFTALLAWFAFNENRDRRIVAGMALIVLAGALLSWEQLPAFGVPWGSLAIVAACLCWAVDNNLTRQISASDPVQIAGIKGTVAGMVNLAVAFFIGLALPDWRLVAAAGVVGFLGYGLSLVLFVLALRHIGTARTGAYFSMSPFIGTAVALVLLGESPGPWFWLAAALMSTGIWLHLTEHHEHPHVHEPMAHTHRHAHDEHHQHEHDFPWDGSGTHTHHHVHKPLLHSHPHYPDTHHRHRH